MQKFLAIKLETILVIARNISWFVFRNTAGTFSGFSQHELRTFTYAGLMSLNYMGVRVQEPTTPDSCWAYHPYLYELAVKVPKSGNVCSLSFP